MLIFFLVAGTLAPPLGSDLSLVKTTDIEGNAPADALIIHADGRMTHQGTTVSDPLAFFAKRSNGAGEKIRLVPDRDLPAAALVRLGRTLREAGAEQVVIVTERGLR
jgi:biopolymer transport protein ExbD